MMQESHKLTIEKDEARQRLDKYLCEKLPTYSRSRLKNLIEEGNLCINNKPILDAGHKIRPDDEIILTIPPLKEISAAPYEFALDIIYEDEHLLVVNKPSGMTTHPAIGSPDKTLVNALMAYCGDSLSGIGGVLRPGIVHRLDKDTSGLIIIAKNDNAHQKLSQQLKDRSLSRIYMAICKGIPKHKQGVINAPIKRHHINRKKMCINNGGREAITEYEIIQKLKDKFALIKCSLKTGRTHQIRVHMQHLGHPLIGDKTYGYSGKPEFHRQALHAFEIRFIHPASNELMRFSADMPQDMQNLLESLQ